MSDSPDYFRLATRYLTSIKPHLVKWRGDFYNFTGSFYSKVSIETMNAGIMKWVQLECRKLPPTIRNRNELIANIEGIAMISPDVEIGSWIRGADNPEKTDLICLKNGILIPNNGRGNQSPSLRPHSPDFFTTACLPVIYQKDATCPIWINFIESSLPIKKMRELLQEWCGLNLVFISTFQKFFILYGYGANGKSVVCTVLAELLGIENISAVGLEAFNPNRTFPIAMTAGKLANICEEMNEIDKAAEGILKQYVSGGAITAEKKHRDPFTFHPTARLTFATNVLPPFVDRSDGIWRRLIIVPFSHQILDEAKQDRRLVDPLFWRNSGELSGILNWALEGLSRLLARGKFDEPIECLQLKRSFREEANLTGTFLQDHCEYRTGSSLSCNELYSKYQDEVRSLGACPLGIAKFSQEIKRVFPKVTKSHAKRLGDTQTRVRFWEGLSYKNEPGHHPSDTGNTASGDFSSYNQTHIGSTMGELPVSTVQTTEKQWIDFMKKSETG